MGLECGIVISLGLSDNSGNGCVSFQFYGVSFDEIIGQLVTATVGLVEHDRYRFLLITLPRVEPIHQDKVVDLQLASAVFAHFALDRQRFGLYQLCVFSRLF